MADVTTTDPDRTALELLIRGFQVSRMLRAAADLALADEIPVDGRCSAHELATACGVPRAPLWRMLRALTAFGIFRTHADDTVEHTPRSLLLRKDAPRSLHYSARFWAAPGSWRAWGEFDAALAGESPHQRAWNTSRFQYLREHPDESRIFADFMAHFSDDRHRAVADSYDFSGARLIADLGGSNGETLRRILGRFPDARGVVLDREDVVSALPPDATLGGRIVFEGGSFFDCIPTGADLYLFVRVLHDWSDPDCIRILQRCRAAMAPTARLLIVEQILDPDPTRGDPIGYLIDMQMMAMFGDARERTEAEFSELLAASGLALERVLGTASPVCIIEAVPVPRATGSG